MRSIRHVASAVAVIATSFAAAPLSAQAPESGTVFHVSPYVGYMVFGDYIKGPLGTSVSNAPGALYGTQVGLSLSPNLSLIGNLAYTTSDIKVGVPILGGVGVGNSSTLLYDAGLEYNLGRMSTGTIPLSPFVQAGAGAMKYDINAASIIQTHATNFAGNIGVGADVTLGKGMAVRLLAKDYIGKFNFQDATGLGLNGDVSHNLAFTAGLRFDF
jgi:outer membrane protein with beta-barrel domain